MHPAQSTTRLKGQGRVVVWEEGARERKSNDSNEQSFRPFNPLEIDSSKMSES